MTAGEANEVSGETTLYGSWSLERGEHIKHERSDNLTRWLDDVTIDLQCLHSEFCLMTRDERRKYRKQLDRILDLARLNAEL